MTRGTAVAAGLVVGMLAAAAATAAVVPWLPPSLRGATAMWTTAAGAVALTLGLFWALSTPSDD